ncbi:hypothetical protein QBZ16_001605 [Prototheca wickerhamii]|uniref:CobW C-terminal domain-containing protein n=1 Tax=Prototheca wickerhamii TaxID=3111 RepID=A0AAD9IDG2_PROWI|nr:hypothetical protein QBZ16_001605 [Prototheca wickerhamii]
MVDAPRSVPVTMLSGFLGAGKTSLLRHVLQHSGLKIGCIVNDVAAVNIDAKLIRADQNRADPSSTTDLADTIELANGCACCSIADELMLSFANLIELSDRRETPYDRIILENSGVAEPQNIRDQFSDAIMEGHPLMSRIHLDSLVTLVDSGTFIKEYSSRAPLVSRPDLGEGGGLRPVVDLLVEQIECADYVVLNKTDLLDEATTGSLSAIVSSLNPLAQVVTCQHGAVPCEKLFGSEAQALVALLNTEGQHRGAVAAARTAHEAALREEREEKERKEREEKEAHKHGKESNGHGHAHDHAGHDHAGHDHDAHGHKHDSHDSHKQNGHAHDEHKHHDHGEHKHEAQNGHKHHGHDHDHAHHDHEHHDHDSHEHHDHDSHDSHDHSSHPHKHHKHSHDRKETTAAKRFGITSFVYSRRRPFHPQRLKDLVLKWMPVSHNKTLEGAERAEDGASPIKAVLRSKGFMWVANSHTTAFYWSHAGQYFEIRDEGEWWAAVPDDMWPEVAAQRAIILADFDASAGFGDRRQEIVFIGAGMDEKAISAQLDSALLTDEEMEDYKTNFDEPDPLHVGEPARA